LTCIITHRCDRYGHTDFGLRPGEVGHSEIDKTLHVVNFATVEYASRSTGQALHPSTSMAYGAGRAGIAELKSKTKHRGFQVIKSLGDFM